MRENGKIINCMGKGYIHGLMVENMKVVGKNLICMVKVNILGKMGDIMMVSIITIKSN